MRRYSQGFTLIELLVVVALIGILSSIAVISYTGYKKSAEQKQAEISLNSIYLAQQEYKSNNGEYCISDCNSSSKIIQNLFDDIDDLSDQNFNFSISGNASNDTFTIQAKNKNSNCTLTLNEKNKLNKNNC